jgi:stearoyl-CoA desaturase (delta-9 desaturase)
MTSRSSPTSRGPTRARLQHARTALTRWFDASVGSQDVHDPDRIDWLRVIPFIGLHVACLGVIWVGFSWIAFWTALGLYLLRMFAITGFYHRYFSHKAFKTSRALQLVFAILGATTVQRGPLWWAAQHRHHHRHADTPDDLHSPAQRGFWMSHVGWFLTPRAFATDLSAVPDLARFQELRWLDRFDILVPIALAAALYSIGAWLESSAPQLGTNGPQMLVWGFFISTVALFHVTVTINSLAHRFGRRRFPTRDDSRNNLWLALLTFGEGWHNNHHHFPGSARQGFRWWEVDVTYYLLRGMAAIGLVWDLRPAPANLVRNVAGSPAHVRDGEMADIRIAPMQPVQSTALDTAR